MGGCCSAPELPPINPHRVDLSHLEIYRVVGRGAFGKVSACLHRPTGEIVALKRSVKERVLKKKHSSVVWTERRVMSVVTSPFLVNALFTFQNNAELFVVMPFLRGGDLRWALSQRGPMTEDSCKFYAAQILLGMQNLHEHRFLYRDLKPANVLLDADGYLRISDFGLVKRLRRAHDYKTRGYAGTRGFIAPEVIRRQEYGFEADMWSFGAVVYELLHGQLPFKSEEAVVGSKLRPSNFLAALSANCVSFLRELLRKDPIRRLGGGLPPGKGWDQIKQHAWLADVDWEKLQAKQLPAPFKPEVDVAHCSPQFEAEDQLLENKAKLNNVILTAEQQAVFSGWSFNREEEEQKMAERARRATVAREREEDMEDERLMLANDDETDRVVGDALAKQPKDPLPKDKLRQDGDENEDDEEDADGDDTGPATDAAPTSSNATDATAGVGSGGAGADRKDKPDEASNDDDGGGHAANNVKEAAEKAANEGGGEEDGGGGGGGEEQGDGGAGVADEDVEIQV